MSVPAGQQHLSIHLTEEYPIGQTSFPAWYFDFLRDLAKMPWPRIPQTYTRFAVKAAAELRIQRGRQTSRSAPKVVVG